MFQTTWNNSMKVLPFRQRLWGILYRRSQTCGYENFAFQAIRLVKNDILECTLRTSQLLIMMVAANGRRVRRPYKWSSKWSPQMVAARDNPTNGRFVWGRGVPRPFTATIIVAWYEAKQTEKNKLLIYLLLDNFLAHR